MERAEEVDLENSTPRVRVGVGDQKAISQVFVDDLNAHGGILGRKIQPVYQNYCPIGNSQALALCTSMTEDQKVFAVLGILYDASGDADLCLTRDHQTIYDGFELNQAWIDQSPPALMVTIDYPAERRTVVLMNVLKAQGTLAGKKVATLVDQNSVSTVTSVIKPALDRMGVAQGSAAVLTIIGSDTSAAQSQLDSYIEKWKSEGVNAIFLAGQFVASKQFVEKIKRQMPNVLLMADGFSSAQLAGQDETAAGVKPNPDDGMITLTDRANRNNGSSRPSSSVSRRTRRQPARRWSDPMTSSRTRTANGCAYGPRSVTSAGSCRSSSR